MPALRIRAVKPVKNNINFSLSIFENPLDRVVAGLSIDKVIFSVLLSQGLSKTY